MLGIAFLLLYFLSTFLLDMSLVTYCMCNDSVDLCDLMLHWIKYGKCHCSGICCCAAHVSSPLTLYHSSNCLYGHFFAGHRPRSNSQPVTEGSGCVNTPALSSLRVITAVCFTLFPEGLYPSCLAVSYLMRHPLFAAFSS